MNFHAIYVLHDALKTRSILNDDALKRLDRGIVYKIGIHHGTPITLAQQYHRAIPWMSLDLFEDFDTLEKVRKIEKDMHSALAKYRVIINNKKSEWFATDLHTIKETFIQISSRIPATDVMTDIGEKINLIDAFGDGVKIPTKLGIAANKITCDKCKKGYSRSYFKKHQCKGNNNMSFE